ncbi:MAG: hypothetical protein AB8B96_09140 [Lysobacterales bacterium]
MKPLNLLIASLALAPLTGFAHDADPLDKNGCHEDTRFNKYHCHSGVLEGRSFDNADEIAKALIKEAIRPKNQSSAGQTEDLDVDPS